MRAALMMTALVAALGVAQAHADGAKYTCSKGEAVRTVAVVTRPASGRACEVRYEKAAAEKPETLWHAASDTSFCSDHAKIFVANLGKSGWNCTESAGETAATKAMPEPFAAAVEVAKPGKTGDFAPAPVGVTAATQPMPMQAAPVAVPPTARQPIDPKNTAVDGRMPIDPGIHLRGSIH